MMISPSDTEFKIPIDEVIKRLQEAKEIGHTHFVSHGAIFGYDSGFIIETQKIEEK